MMIAVGYNKRCQGLSDCNTVYATVLSIIIQLYMYEL